MRVGLEIIENGCVSQVLCSRRECPAKVSGEGATHWLSGVGGGTRWGNETIFTGRLPYSAAV